LSEIFLNVSGVHLDQKIILWKYQCQYDTKNKLQISKQKLPFELLSEVPGRFSVTLSFNKHWMTLKKNTVIQAEIGGLMQQPLGEVLWSLLCRQ